MNKNLNSLIARVLSGNGSAEDQQRLDLWLAQNEANKTEYQNFKKIWEKSLLLKKDSDADIEMAWLDFQDRIVAAPKSESKRTLQYLRIAAGIALVAVLAVIVNFVLDAGTRSETLASLSRPISVRNLPEPAIIDTIVMDEDSSEFYTPDTTLQIDQAHKNSKRVRRNKNVVLITYATKDSARAFYLPDNSIVFLNEHSSVVYEEGFGKTNRKLNLTGEAYFEVVNDSIPFAVSCGKTLSQTKNGFFNLREMKAENQIEIITANGQVEFSGVGKHQYKKLVLESGERAVYSEESTLVKEANSRKDYKWWQKKGLRAKLRSLINKIKNTFK